MADINHGCSQAIQMVCCSQLLLVTTMMLSFHNTHVHAVPSQCTRSITRTNNSINNNHISFWNTQFTLLRAETINAKWRRQNSNSIYKFHLCNLECTRVFFSFHVAYYYYVLVIEDNLSVIFHIQLYIFVSTCDVFIIIIITITVLLYHIRVYQRCFGHRIALHKWYVLRVRTTYLYYIL